MLDKAQIEHLAQLARLDATEEEKEKYAKQISSILVYFKQLDEVNVDKVKATDHITGLEDVVRPDEVRVISSAEKVLSVAPEVEKRQVKVKAVFE